MGHWDNNGWNWELKWSRDLNGRDTAILNELLLCINRSKPIQDGSDGWRWNHSSNGMFSSSLAYRKLEDRDEAAAQVGNEAAVFDRMWSSSAPKRHQAIVWKVLKERMPTRDQLRRRGIIPASGEASCVLCSDHEENISHVFFHCNFSSEIWCKILDWLGTVTALHKRAVANFMIFSDLCGYGKIGKYMSTI
ncbi:hypothetical protein ACS0TY_015314 [Phlomoides rotata]